MNPRRQVEIELRRWLSGHHSVIGDREALRVGASREVIEYKVDRGEWSRLYRAVYRDTASPGGHYQDLRAACVATAGLGVASHASAAWVWGLLRQPPAPMEVTIRRGDRDARGHPAYTVHHSRDLDLSAAIVWNAIPVTNPLRTLVDLAATRLSPQQLTEAVDVALARQLVTVAGLQAEIDRLSGRGRDGVGVLRHHLLDRGFAGAPNPSVLEAHTRRLIRGTGLPSPNIEVHVSVGEAGQYRLDTAWGGILFAVEVDGYVWHFSPEHMQRDVQRRNRLQAAGWTLLVYTWQQVLREPTRVANEITATYLRLSKGS